MLCDTDAHRHLPWYCTAAGHPGNLKRGGTLVIAPVTLLGQWRDEIERACNADNPLKVCIFHGSYSRTTNPTELASYDVVLTTPGVAIRECGRWRWMPKQLSCWH
jgi:hypothetical protein